MDELAFAAYPIYAAHNSIAKTWLQVKRGVLLNKE